MDSKILSLVFITIFGFRTTFSVPVEYLNKTALASPKQHLNTISNNSTNVTYNNSISLTDHESNLSNQTAVKNSTTMLEPKTIVTLNDKNSTSNASNNVVDQKLNREIINHSTVLPINVSTSTPPSTSTTVTTPITLSTTTSKPSDTTSSNTTSGMTSTSISTVVTTPIPISSHDRQFDGPSFVGGIVLAGGLTAICFIAFKYYKSGKLDRNYRTL